MSPDAPPRVLVAIGSLEVGGAERQVLEVCRILEGEFRFDVVTMGREGPIGADLKSAAAGVHSLRVEGDSSGRAGRFLRLARAIPRFRSLSRRLGPDLVHAYLPEMSAVAAASRWPGGPPLIVSKRTLVGWMARDPIYFLLARWINRRADLLLANSEAVRKDAITKEGADPERIRVIPNGVDTERFRPGPPDDALARDLDLPAGVPVVGMVANFFRYKGHAEVIDAVAHLRAQGLRLALLFVGREGNASREVRRRIQEKGLTDSVRLAGPRPDVFRLLRLFDVYVSASYEEGFSNSILEAMASGRAIVATSVGGTVEQIEDGVTGLLFPAPDPEALARSLARVLSDSDLRARLGSAAREVAVARFSIQLLAARMSSFYRAAMREKFEASKMTDPR